VSSSRCGIFVPVELRFNGPTLWPRENALFWGSLGQRVQLGRAAALYCRVSTADQTLCPPGTGPTRLRQEGWLQNRGGLEGESPPAQSRSAPNARRSWRWAQAHKVDVILVTEPTSWAAPSLTCFKFRFVSSPHKAIVGPAPASPSSQTLPQSSAAGDSLISMTLHRKILNLSSQQLTSRKHSRPG